ncbi:TPA: hypothetical protein ACGO8F_001428 [Streptococcus suis]
MATVSFEKKSLYGIASGAIVVTSVEDDIISVVVSGRYVAKENAKSVTIGKLPYYSNGRFLFPVAASRSIRDRDTVMQIDPDGTILLLNVVAGTEYTFNQSVPFTW